MKQRSTLGILGYVRVIFVLGAYILLSFGVINAGYLFQILTLIGSLVVAVEAWVSHDRQPAILNGIFALIAVAAILRLFLGQ